MTIVPPTRDEWLHQNTERLLARRCAYWENLKGRQPTANRETITIEIPKSQIFSPENLADLMRRADTGDLDD